MKGKSVNKYASYVCRCCVAAAFCLTGMPVIAQDSARLALGEKAFASSCKSCHDTGKAENDAPQLSEQAEWKDRAGKGRADLYKSAVEGFTGYFAMPARGGNAALSDDEVKAAVDYMLLRAGVK
jgi:cytochrome c5